MKFTIIAIPNKKVHTILNKLRQFFYCNNFRYSKRNATGIAHITLAQWELEELQIIELKNHFISAFASIKKWDIHYTEVTNRVHERVYNDQEAYKKYPDWCSRVALLFDDQILKTISSIARSVLSSNNCDTTDLYIDNIKKNLALSMSDHTMGDCIADHMNICNYARIDKWAEAQEIIRKVEEIKSINIDRIGLYTDSNELVWDIALQ